MQASFVSAVSSTALIRIEALLGMRLALLIVVLHTPRKCYSGMPQ